MAVKSIDEFEASHSGEVNFFNIVLIEAKVFYIGKIFDSLKGSDARAIYIKYFNCFCFRKLYFTIVIGIDSLGYQASCKVDIWNLDLLGINKSAGIE